MAASCPSVNASSGCGLSEYDPEAVAEDTRGDELRLGRKAGLLVKGEEPGVLRGVEIDGLAVEGGRGLGCPSAFPSFRVLLLFIHACCH